jgi:glycosyltransferase involved in cell wall biosynthesis
MNILWIINAPFPEVSEKLKLDNFVKGWVYSSAYELINRYPNLTLGVASIYSGKISKQLEIDNIKHFLIPNRARTDATNKKNDFFWIEVKNQFNPDIVHIHGSEYPYSYSYVRACGVKNVVVSIQGLVSIIDRYYLGGICPYELLRKITLRDIIRIDTIFSKHNDLKLRSKYEILLFQEIEHVIGRTEWDRLHVKGLNSNIKYHFCNETLRPSFYINKWSIKNCKRHTIFISQAHYPLKGFHQLIKALPLVIKNFPDTKVYVSGNKIYENKGIRNKGYGRYVYSLMKKYNISDRFVNTGFLSEKEMCKIFLDSHIFISPSMIENSSNSIGEAQIMGVPCIATNVGGSVDMILHGETGFLYRFEEYEMLAYYICRIFSDDNLAIQISTNSRMIASERHSKEKNANALYSIYSKVIS